MNLAPLDLPQRHFRRNLPADQRTVTAAKVQEWARRKLPIDFRHAIIKGPLDLANTVFPQPVSFLQCEFTDLVDLSGCCFDALVLLSGSIFHGGISFRGSTFRGDWRLKSIRIPTRQQAQFNDVVVEGLFWGNRLRIAERAHFLGARFQKAAFFSGACFEKEAVFEFAKFADYVDFSRAVFGCAGKFENARIGMANFDGAMFEAKAEFGSVYVEKDFLFGSHANDRVDGVNFHGDAIFTAATIMGVANFRGATFRGKYTSFNGVRFGGSAFFRSEAVEKPNDTSHCPRNVTTFEGETNFIACRFEGSADFRGVVFRKAVDFNRIRCQGKALFRSEYLKSRERNLTVFGAKADFTSAFFGQIADFQGVQFNSDAIFQSVEFGNRALFGPGPRADGDVPLLLTEFCGEASFNYAKFGIDALFNGASFSKAAKFSSAKFEKDALFIGAEFKDKAHFDAITVDGKLLLASDDEPDKITSFEGVADFEQADMAQGDFRGVQFLQSVFFREAHIRGKADFSASIELTDHKQHNAIFAKWADFTGVDIDESADFEEAVFEEGVSFEGAKFGGQFTFKHVTFTREENFKPAKSASPPGPRAAFRGCQFKRQSIFSGTTFQSLYVGQACASFDYASFGEVADFEDVIFNNKVTFCGSSFRSLTFSEEGMARTRFERGTRIELQFKGRVDLGGCKYEHIIGSWNHLLRADQKSGYKEFDHQPYVQFEKTLRQAGKDRDADAVYLEHRKRYRHKKWHNNWFAWLGDAVFFWGLANYGVRPWRLVLIAFVVVVAGLFTFHRFDAVEFKKDEKPNTALTAAPSATPAAAESGKDDKKFVSSHNTNNKPDKRIQLTWRKAGAVTFHQFLPIDVPVGSRWVPTRRTEVYATLLKITGAILVPLGIAIITGLLRRITR